MSIQHVNAISGRLSLRPPQRDSLRILHRVCELVRFEKDTDLAQALESIRSGVLETPYLSLEVNDGDHYDFGMARLARVVAPGFPHHITQRGNRRQQTFCCQDDYRACLGLMAEWCGRCEKVSMVSPEF